VRTIELSDRVSDLLMANQRLLATVRNQREADDVRWQERVAEHRQARAARPWWRRLIGLSTPEERAARFCLDDADLARADADRRVAELEERIPSHPGEVRGEQIFDIWLAGLSDDWSLLCGYRNRKGEIDRLLIGPGGVWAFGVRGQRVVLHVDGEDWRCAGVDGGVDLSGGSPATDEGGRSWGRQVVEPAADLAVFLTGRNHSVPVGTGVVLVADGARVATCRRAGVDLVTARADEVLAAIDDAPHLLAASTRSAVIRLIEKDHRHHARRRAAAERNRRTSGPAAFDGGGATDTSA
jgi:hypothetical protein